MANNNKITEKNISYLPAMTGPFSKSDQSNGLK